jgi:N-methylhydantoinase A
MSIERGHDPARFAAVPFGGGGALHVSALIKDVGLKAALVPRYPGVTSALGCVMADIRHDQVQTLNMFLDRIDIAALRSWMLWEAEHAREVVMDAKLAMERVEIAFELDMHYVGQTHTIRAPVPVEIRDGTIELNEAILRTAFEQAYQKSFSRLLPGLPVKIVNLRTSAIGVRPSFDLKALAPGADADLDKARLGQRPVWFDGKWWPTAIHARLDLPVGAEIEGPAILEQPDATTVIAPDFVARVDQFGNIIVERRQ